MKNEKIEGLVNLLGEAIYGKEGLAEVTEFSKALAVIQKLPAKWHSNMIALKAKCEELEKKLAEKETPTAEPKPNKKENASQFDCLAVTSVSVWINKNEPKSYIKATANIVLNDQIIIRSLRVIDGENGLFVGYPRDTLYKGEDFRTTFNPITRALREEIEYKVLEKYQTTLAQNV